MARPLATPEVILAARQDAHAEGHKLTYRRLCNVALNDYNGYAESTDRKTLLAQATAQLLKTKRAKALGPVNGERRYSGSDRFGKGAPSGSASLHGAPPSTRL